MMGLNKYKSIFNFKKNNKNEAFELELLTDMEKQIFEYYIKYHTGNMTKEDVKELCVLTMKYCKAKKYSDVSLEIPKMEFCELEDWIGGQYSRYKNSIQINEKTIDRILSKEYSFFRLLVIIGHEMEHYRQNSDMLEYDKMSPEQQVLANENSREYIKSFKNYFRLKEDDVEIFHKLFAPHLQKDEIPQGYETLESFYQDVSMSSYFTITAEKNARKEGYYFSLRLYELLLNHKQTISHEQAYGESEQLYIDFGNDLRLNSQREKILSKFLEEHNIDDENKILEVVEKVEGSNKLLREIDSEKYRNVLNYLMSKKTLKQKQSLLKCAVDKGYELFISSIVESMGREIDFKSNYNETSSFVRDCLINYAKENSVFYNSYRVNYSNLLTQKDLESVITNALISNNGSSAKQIVQYNDMENCSLSSLVNFQKITRARKGNEIFMDRDDVFYERLFNHMKIEDKIAFLKSKFIDYDIKWYIVKNIAQDKNYDNYKEEIDKVLKIINKEHNENKDTSPLYEFLKEIGIENFHNRDRHSVKDKTPRGVQYAALMDLAESEEAKKVVNKIYEYWNNKDGFDLYSIRLILLAIKNGKLPYNIGAILNEIFENESNKLLYLLRDAIRIARADNLKYEGDKLFKYIPPEEAFDEMRKKKDEQPGGPQR